MRKVINYKGFTLIEISIVVVVIGLIVAGVVGGSALLKQSSMRGQISQLQKYQVAHNSFKLAYVAIPGDFNRASSYWSGATNGNGNNRIDLSPVFTFQANNENRHFWIHLSAAGLDEAVYSGGTMKIGVTHPAMELNENFGMTAGGPLGDTSGCACGAEAGSVYQLSAAVGTIRYKAALFLNDSRSYSGVTNNNFHSGEGTANAKTYFEIDKKIDDGLARTGTFRAYRARNDSPNCLNATDGDYLFTNEQLVCSAFYILEGS